MNTPLEIVVRLFDLLEKEGIRYCLWKGSQHLAAVLNGQSDLDLLVEKTQSTRFERILIDLGFKRFVSQPWARYPGVEDWIGFDRETGKLVHIHLYYRLVLGSKFVEEYTLPWEDLILNTARKDSTFKVFIADPNLEIILLCIRICFKTTIFQVLSAFLGASSLNKNLWGKFVYLSKRIDDGSVQDYANLPPDGVIKLQVPLEIAIERKPDHSPDNIRRKAEITSELRFTGAKVIDIDASKPLTDVLHAVKQVVWESL